MQNVYFWRGKKIAKRVRSDGENILVRKCFILIKEIVVESREIRKTSELRKLGVIRMKTGKLSVI